MYDSNNKPVELVINGLVPNNGIFKVKKNGKEVAPACIHLTGLKNNKYNIFYQQFIDCSTITKPDKINITVFSVTRGSDTYDLKNRSGLFELYPNDIVNISVSYDNYGVTYDENAGKSIHCWLNESFTSTSSQRIEYFENVLHGFYGSFSGTLKLKTNPGYAITNLSISIFD